MAALEVVKLHQLVITENKNENFMKSMNSSEAIDEETIEDAVACLLVSDSNAVEKESWMNKKTTGYRAQKATKTVRAKITQVEEFSKYLISPMKKKYDVFFRSRMIAFKAIRCWLKLKISKQAPKNLADKRKRIDDRLTALVRNLANTTSVTKIPDEADDIKDDIYKFPTVRKRKRIGKEQREEDIRKVLKYNILKKKEDRKINDWKSYPGVSKIISMARDMIDNGNKDHIDEVATLMQCHESQQSAAIIATIAIIIGNKMKGEAIVIDERY